MRLYTIQTRAAWENWQAKGILVADLKHIDPYYLPAYQWMISQMQQFLNVSCKDFFFPVWAWYQWESEKKPKPDLRAKGHLPSGDLGILVTLEVNPEQVLLSDFDLWHYVLNYAYLGKSMADIEAFEYELTQYSLTCHWGNANLNTVYHQTIRASWTRIFDLDWSEEGIADRKENKQIQATLCEFDLNQVIAIREFTAR